MSNDNVVSLATIDSKPRHSLMPGADGDGQGSLTQSDETMHSNPHSPGWKEMRECGVRIKPVTEGRDIETVCDYNYVVAFDDWMPRFERLLAA